MNADTLTPASRKVLSHLGNAWVTEPSLLAEMRVPRHTLDNGIRELVRDDLIECEFRHGTKCWRRTA